MAKPSSPVFAEKLEWFEKLVATNPTIERKGSTVPYTAVNGHMFTYLTAAGLALRLPDGLREEFLAKYNTKLYEVSGVVQKEYVLVPDALLANTTELKPYFDLSHAYAGTLKPKAAKKAKGR
jgi:hypothetical protein